MMERQQMKRQENKKDRDGIEGEVIVPFPTVGRPNQQRGVESREPRGEQGCPWRPLR
jgi:hypothetical protein